MGDTETQVWLCAAQRRFTLLPKWARFSATFSVLLASFSVQAVADHAVSPKYDTLRFENEIIAELPIIDDNEAWLFLKQTFANPSVIEGMRFETFDSVEQFHDEYYDDRQRTLLKLGGGLRHRYRIGEKGAEKQLIQLKVPPSSGAEATDLTRGEFKFSVSSSRAPQLIKRVSKSQRDLFLDRIRTYGVDPHTLRPLLSIDQERRRVYFRQGENQFFTITIDKAVGRAYWYEASSLSIDFEIGEVAFTKADKSTREFYQRIQEQLFAKVKTRFPLLKVNQTPKVVHMHALLSAQGILPRLLLAWGEILVFSAGALLCLVAVGGIYVASTFRGPLGRAKKQSAGGL